MTNPIPPPPPRTNYALYGLFGVIIGLAIVVLVLLFTSGGDDAASTTSTSSTAPPATETTLGDASSTTAGSGGATSSTTATPTSSTTAAAAFAGTTTAKVADGPQFATFAFLSNIRFAQRAEGFTRVVFDFEGADVPWWSVGYAAGPFTNLGDEPVPVGGTAFLQVILASTSYDLSGAEVRITYAGSDRVAVGTASVVEVVRLEDFEGVSNWVIGVSGEKPFLVGTLTDPPRVYIDIQD